jgi:hypothetical protein
MKVFVKLPNGSTHVRWLTINKKTTVLCQFMDAIAVCDQMLKLRNRHPGLELLEKCLSLCPVGPSAKTRRHQPGDQT